jgi:hypothetical protein
MAQAVSRQPLTAEARVSPCGSVMDEVTVGQVYLEFFGTCLLISFQRDCPY